MTQSAIKRAIEIAGSQSALARALGLSPQAVQKWEANNQVPPARARGVSKLTGIPLEELRPDLWGEYL